MTAGRATRAVAPTEQAPSNNPALNPAAFERGIAQTAPATERRGMTATGTYLKTALLLALLVAGAAFGWSQVRIVTVQGQPVALQPAWTWLVFLLTFILGIAGVFAYRAIPFVGSAYALAEGALLGIASRYFNVAFDGIVLQAVLATLAVFLATLLLYSLGVIKVTSRFAIGVMVAMGGLVLLYGVAFLLSLFGVHFLFLSTPTPLGIALSVAIVIVGALNLPLDFEFIRRASAAGAPKFMEWYGAYGLMLSLIWMYVAILRLLALLRLAR
jgi:uncharacterized YccA/Bax inhibitor family protein